MEITHNVVGWFEIPVRDLDRAIEFYEAVFEFSLQRQDFGPVKMAWFPSMETAMGSPGGLIYDPGSFTPSSEGILIYFTAFSGDLDIELERAEKEGGKIVVPKRLISPEIGYMGAFIDSEGNRIALHSKA